MAIVTETKKLLDGIKNLGEVPDELYENLKGLYKDAKEYMMGYNLRSYRRYFYEAMEDIAKEKAYEELKKYFPEEDIGKKFTIYTNYEIPYGYRGLNVVRPIESGTELGDKEFNQAYKGYRFSPTLNIRTYKLVDEWFNGILKDGKLEYVYKQFFEKSGNRPSEYDAKNIILNTGFDGKIIENEVKNLVDELYKFDQETIDPSEETLAEWERQADEVAAFRTRKKREKYEEKSNPLEMIKKHRRIITMLIITSVFAGFMFIGNEYTFDISTVSGNFSVVDPMTISTLSLLVSLSVLALFLISKTGKRLVVRI